MRQGRRKEFAAFGWDPETIPDPQAEETFMRSKLDWDECIQPAHKELLEWHRTLFAIRGRFAELTDGRFDAATVDFDEDARWLTMTRGALSVACNFAEEEQRVPVGDLNAKEILLASEEDVRLESGAAVLPGHAVAIVKAV